MHRTHDDSEPMLLEAGGVDSCLEKSLGILTDVLADAEGRLRVRPFPLIADRQNGR